MGSFEVNLNRRQVLEHQPVEVMSIGVQIRQQESEVDRIRMKRVTLGQTAELGLVLFIDKEISSKGDFSTPVLSVFVSAFPGGHEILRSSQALSQIDGVFEREKIEVPFIGRMKTCDPPNFLVEVLVSDLSTAGLVSRRQLDQIKSGSWCERIVGVRTSQLSQLMVILKLDHEALGSNWSTLVPHVPESSGSSKASKEQVNLIREKGCSVLEKLVICSEYLLVVSNESKNRDSGWCRLAYVRCCPETSVLEEQVYFIGNMDQVVDPKNLSMHAIQACDLIGKVRLHEAVPVPPVKFFFAFSPFAFREFWQATSIFAYIGSLVRCQGFCFHRRMSQARFASFHSETALSCASCLCRQRRADRKCSHLSSTQILQGAGSGSDDLVAGRP